MLKYFVRLLVYIAVCFIVWSVSAVVVYKWVPVTVTPLKVLRLFDNFADSGLSFRSQWVSLDEISPAMIDAVVAAEDNHFIEHVGIDFEQVKKAWRARKHTDRLRGASTISQQTAKNVFCIPSRTWFRKGVEAWYTLLIEMIWGKRRIMEVYLNIIETGTNVYGVEGAAQRFYDKSASELNTYEASMIAAVLPSPRVRNLAAPSNYMVQRAAHIRRLMRKVTKVRFQEDYR